MARARSENFEKSPRSAKQWAVEAGIFLLVVLLGLAVAVPSLSTLGIIDSNKLSATISDEGFRSFDFRSVYDEESNTLSVTEQLVVNVRGEQIKAGFHRILPLRLQKEKDRFEYRYSKFRVLRKSVETGEVEEIRIDSADVSQHEPTNTLYVRLGRPGQNLEPGLYQYRISYDVHDAMHRLKDGSRGFMFALNMERQFPIDQLSVSVQPFARRGEDSPSWDFQGQSQILLIADADNGKRKFSVEKVEPLGSSADEVGSSTFFDLTSRGLDRTESFLWFIRSSEA